MTTMSTAPLQAPPRHAEPSAREVAELAGVSLSTVSRVFRDSPLVNAETSRRVREAAAEIGYSPSNFARSLRTGVSSTVGFLLRRPTGLLGEFHAKAFGAIQERIAQMQLNPLVAAIPAGTRPMELARQMLAREALCGLIVQGDNLGPGAVEELAEFPRPAVVLNYSEPLPADCHLAAAGFDNGGGIEQAVRHLVALGHERIAFISGNPGNNDARLREEGFRAALGKVGLEHLPEFIRFGDFGRLHGGFQSGAAQMEFLLSLRPKPTAVLAASDEIAVGAIDTAWRCGLRVPDDVSVVGYDNHSWSPYVRPSLTTIEHDGWRLGEAAADLLLGLLQEKRLKSRQVLLCSQLVVRQSTGLPRAGA